MVKDYKNPKVIKRIVIKPSKMVVVKNTKEKVALNAKLCELLGITWQDIEFTYIELDK